MDATQKRRFEARAQVLRALAHPARLYLTELLAREGERRVQDLADQLDLDLSTVSRHLAQLRNVGILEAERRGNQVFYSLRVPCLDGLFRCIEGVLSDQAQESRAALGEEASG